MNVFGCERVFEDFSTSSLFVDDNVQFINVTAVTLDCMATCYQAIREQQGMSTPIRKERLQISKQDLQLETTLNIVLLSRLESEPFTWSTSQRI